MVPGPSPAAGGRRDTANHLQLVRRGYLALVWPSMVQSLSFDQRLPPCFSVPGAGKKTKALQTPVWRPVL